MASTTAPTHFLGGLVDPVHVFKEQHQWPLGGFRHHQGL